MNTRTGAKILERALKGTALLFVRSEVHLSSYALLKQALLQEFGDTSSAAQIHQALAARRYRSNEKLFEYYLIMKEIATRGNIDDVSLIHYIIAGIQDTAQNKSVLFGCTTLNEFKSKLKIYEEITQGVCPPVQKSQQFRAARNETYKPFSAAKSTPSYCYNCGDKMHKSDVCPSKQKGPKCFTCSEFGHKSFQCASARTSKHKPTTQGTSPLNRATSNANEQIHVVEQASPQDPMHKIIKISGNMIYALIDTGSPSTLIREDAYLLMNLPKLEPTTLILTGFGGSSTKPLGSLSVDIEIDDHIFPTTAYVINRTQMNLPIIIGTDVTSQGTLTYDKNGITLSKPNPDNVFVYLVNAVNDQNNVDLNHGCSDFAQYHTTDDLVLPSPSDVRLTITPPPGVISDSTVEVLQSNISQPLSNEEYFFCDNDVLSPDNSASNSTLSLISPHNSDKTLEKNVLSSTDSKKEPIQKCFDALPFDVISRKSSVIQSNIFFIVGYILYTFFHAALHFICHGLTPTSINVYRRSRILMCFAELFKLCFPDLNSLWYICLAMANDIIKINGEHTVKKKRRKRMRVKDRKLITSV